MRPALGQGRAAQMKCHCLSGMPSGALLAGTQACASQTTMSWLQKDYSLIPILMADIALQRDFDQYLKRMEKGDEACMKPPPPFRPRPSCLRYETRPAHATANPLTVCH